MTSKNISKPVEEGFYEQPWGSIESNFADARKTSRNSSKSVEEGFYEQPWGCIESNVVLDKYRIDSRKAREQRKPDVVAVTSGGNSDNVNIPSNQDKNCNIPTNQTQTEIQSSILTSCREENSSSAYNTGDSCCSTPLASPDQHTEADGSTEFGQHCKSNDRSLYCEHELHINHPSTSPNYCNLEELRLDIQSLDIGTRVQKTSCDSLEISSGSNGCSSSGKGSNDSLLEVPQVEGGDVSLPELYTRYAEVMYTNRDNLEHTMKIQQSLFEQQLNRSANNSPRTPRPSRKSIPYLTATTAVEPSRTRPRLCDFEDNQEDVSHQQLLLRPGLSMAKMALHEEYLVEDNRTDNNFPDSSTLSPLHHSRTSNTGTPASPAGEVPMEWVIKRRGDGSRYITRRPVKKQLLRERALRVAEQRCGMTTDDDVKSELKVGRYWSKDERRRQLEQARSDRKLRDLKVYKNYKRILYLLILLEALILLYKSFVYNPVY